ESGARVVVVTLLKSGVVHVTALVEPSAIGANEQMGLGLRCRGDAEALGTALEGVGYISFLDDGFGRYDLLGTLTASDRCRLVEALEEVRLSPGVVDVETWEYLSVRKERRGGEQMAEWVTG